MVLPQELERIVVVLNEPQDPVNIGGVVRAMKNMGLSRLHLVRPGGFDPYRIEGVAHTGMDVVEAARSFDNLPAALATARLVLGTTARGRRTRREYRRPREAAGEAIDTARMGADVALVFGREERGLSNAELDLCQRAVVIPTDPEHSSINLAQAVLLLAYEILLATEAELEFKRPRHRSVPASSEELEQLYAEVKRSLSAVDFFKAHQPTAIMRTVREVGGRADLDSREAALFRAVAIEVRKYLARREGLADSS